MDAKLQARAEQLATEFANEHHTAEELNSLIRLMTKTALERMLNSELDVHLGRRAAPAALSAAPSQETPAGGEPAAAAAKALAQPSGRHVRRSSFPSTSGGAGFDEKILASCQGDDDPRYSEIAGAYGVDSGALISEITPT
jgi:hypothetical protein